jgi:hypothetical protein
MTRTNTLLILTIIVLALAACVKRTEPIGHPPAPAPGPDSPGVYALAAGINVTMVNGLPYISSNDSNYKSTLAFYNLTTKTVDPDRFSHVNGPPLGFHATDMGLYGSKLYIVMAGSGNITVVDAATTRLLARTAVTTQSKLASICFYDGSAYVSVQNGTIAVLDTVTLKVTRYIDPGLAYDQSYLVHTGPAVANGKLYLPGYNFVTVIDPRSGTTLNTIPVYLEPSNISADALGNVYVQSSYDTTDLNWGTFNEYWRLTGGLTVISSATDKVVHQAPAEVLGSAAVAVAGNAGYYIGGNSGSSYINQFNAATLTFNLPFYNTGLQLQDVTALTADPSNGQLLVGNSQTIPYTFDGSVDVFANQQLLYSFSVGTLPVKIIPLH